MKFYPKTLLLKFLLIGGIAVGFYSCTHAPYVLPVGMRTGDPNMCFETDILPIFVSNCTKSGCHDAATHQSGYTLDSYEHIMKKGIVPGNSAASKIFESVAMNTFSVSHMPVGGGADISANDIALLREWIQTGAIEDSGSCGLACDSSNFTYSGAIEPLIQTYCVGCHNSPSSAGGMLTTYALVENAAVNGKLMGNITHASGYNAMPPTGISLSDCQVAQFRKWVAAGAPND